MVMTMTSTHFDEVNIEFSIPVAPAYLSDRQTEKTERDVKAETDIDTQKRRQKKLQVRE